MKELIHGIENALLKNLRGKKSLCKILGFLAIFLLGATPLHASGSKVKNVNTGAVYTNLQTAIDDASAGDVLKLKGTFIGPFVIAKSLTLTSSNNAVLDGAGTAKVLDISQNGAIIVQLENLTIQNGSSPAGGGISNVATLTLLNVDVINNKATAGGGIANSVFGEETVGPAKLTLINSKIFGNEAGAGGGIINLGGTVIILNSDVNYNVALLNGGGIYSLDGTNIITHSEVNHNKALAEFGGGLYTISGSRTTITDSEVDGNTAFQGGGLYNLASSITVVLSKLNRNHVDTLGGGLFNDSLGVATFDRSEVEKNSAANGGGIVNNPGATLHLFETEVEDNRPNNVLEL